jgi:hypothetical protein
MARALMGHVGPVRNDVLAAEIVRLRRRVSELEAEVARLRETHDANLDSHIDIELHQIAGSAEPALA